MNKARCQGIAAEVLSAIKGIGEAHDCVVAYKGGSFSDSSATIKFEFAESAADGTVMTKMATDFQHYAESVGLKADDLGKSFESRGNTFKIVGFKPRATKMPVIAERADGKRFKFSEDDVSRHLKAAAG